jgi:hypothetical protein
MKHFKLVLNTREENLELIKGCAVIADLCPTGDVLCPSVAKDLCMKQGEGPVICSDTELCWTDGDPCPTDVPCISCDVSCDTYYDTETCDGVAPCFFDDCTDPYCTSYGG